MKWDGCARAAAEHSVGLDALCPGRVTRERRVSPEATYVKEEACLPAGILSAVQGCHGRLRRAVPRL